MTWARFGFVVLLIATQVSSLLTGVYLGHIAQRRALSKMVPARLRHRALAWGGLFVITWATLIVWLVLRWTR
jgi:hypothetical protein